MAKDKSTGNSGSSNSTQKLDLSSWSGFMQAVNWISNHVLSNPEGSILELDLLLAGETKERPESRARIFMDPKNSYVFGFRGKDAVYLLQEKGSDFEGKLRKAKLIGENEKPVPINIGTSHSSLGTFEPVTGTSGKKARTFGLADLQSAGKLAGYSKNSGDVSHQNVREALSLLVCMTAESARLRVVETEFYKIYRNDRATAETSIQDYSKVSRIVAYADAFRDHSLAHRVERLHKRAVELNDELARMHEALGKSDETLDRKDLITQALDGTGPQRSEGFAKSAKRIKDIAAELGFRRGSEADRLAEVITLGLQDNAVRAAACGVSPFPKWPTRPITKG